MYQNAAVFALFYETNYVFLRVVYAELASRNVSTLPRKWTNKKKAINIVLHKHTIVPIPRGDHGGAVAIGTQQYVVARLIALVRVSALTSRASLNEQLP